MANMQIDPTAANLGNRISAVTQTQIDTMSVHMSTLRVFALAVLFVALACTHTSARAALDEYQTIFGPNLMARCIQPDTKSLECDYRLTTIGRVDGITSRLGETELGAPELFEFPQPGATSAVLFLIDTSDPNRSAAARAGVRHVRRIISAGDSHHAFGVATFDSDLNVLAEPGASRSQLDAALTQVRASGRTTELYRNALAALRLLSGVNADRKSLVILSDGLAEDRAYYHADVVAMARAEGVTIDGLGYPRSVSLSVGLQTLRRLAEETGGVFVEGNGSYVLSEDYLAAPFAVADDGGTVVFDLRAAIDAGATGRGSLNLDWRVNGSVERLVVPVELPPAPAPAPKPVVIKVPMPAAPMVPLPSPSVAASANNNNAGTSAGASVGPGSATTSSAAAAKVPLATSASDATPGAPAASTTPATDNDTVAPPLQERPPAPELSSSPFVGEFDSLQDWLWLISALLGIVLMGLAWALYAVLRPRPASEAEPQPRAPPVMELAHHEPRQTYAYLEGVDDGGRYPINSAAYRIGRHADNELPINDPSISRHHAQIHRKRDGSFTISDLESMNGVFVNDERLPTSALKEGDLIELGDIKLRFTMLAIDMLDGDETMMMGTQVPGNYGTAA